MIQTSLLYRLNKSFLLVGLILYPIVFFYWGNSVNYYNILNATVFLSYGYLLWASMDKPDDYYSIRRLGITVFVYSIIFVSLYVLMSYTYTGNTFIFSEGDARLYERMGFRLYEKPMYKMIPYLTSQRWGYDDWGAPLGIALMLKVIPSKLFVNFCYILMNLLSSLLLFGIGKRIMTIRYAYMASMAYSISSYSLFFMGCFLKEEMMILLIIASFYLLYKYQEGKILLYLILGGFVSLPVILFRVPVAIFVWASYASLLLLGNKSHIKKVLFGFLIVLVFIIAIGLVQYSSERYTNSGDIAHTYVYATTSLFKKVVLALGAIIGPFPTLLQTSSHLINYKPLFGVGLLYKFLLFFPFWKGVIYCIRTKTVELYPLIVFTLLEIVGLVVVFDGLELRKAMPHVPIFILIAFWYMSQFDEDTDEEIRNTPYYYWTYRGFSLCICIVFIMTLAWNTLIRIPHL